MEQQKKSGNSWRLVLWSIVALILGIGGFATWELRRTPGDAPESLAGASAIRKDVLALTNVDPGYLAELLTPDAAVEQLAKAATAGETTPQARAQALVEALKARRDKLAFVEWSRVEPRADAPLTAAATVRALQTDSAERKLYPLELAAVGVAALRSLGVPAMVAEIYAYPAEKSPLDPSGRFGYFGVFVPEDSKKPPEQHGRVYDAYGGRSMSALPTDVVVLDDVQAVGAALGLRAMHALRVELDIDAADRDSAAALALLPKSPSVLATRAAVLLTVGHPAAQDGKQGRQALEAALQVRDGAAQRTNLALQALTRQDVSGAVKDLGDTLETAPDYALAHVTRGTIMLMKYDLSGAAQELDLAQKLDPELEVVPQMRAQLLAAQGRPDEALAEARKAVLLAPLDAGALFILARIEQRLGLKDELRKHAAQIVERTPQAARQERTEQVRRTLGADVLPQSGGAAGAGGSPGAAADHASL